MTDQSVLARLADTVRSLRGKIAKYRGSKGFNEQNTKASLIVPVLHVLGWDSHDPDEVHWEYRPKPKYNPVDFALLLQRTPCLFLEAKALGETLHEDKLAAQILTYATVAGVQWVVLSNGDEYRIYNAGAPVPIEGKLFRKVAISVDTPEAVVSTLSLLSKQDLQDKRIERLWESHFVDRQVRGAIEEIFSPAEPDKALVRAIRSQLADKLRDAEIKASLRRARLAVDFPEEPDVALPNKTSARERRDKSETESRPPRAAGLGESVSLREVIREGLLPVPAELSSVYRGHDLRATVQADGTVVFEGAKFASPSAAGGAARRPFFKGHLKGKYPATNGWSFWLVKDPLTGEPVALDALRERYLAKKKNEAQRFVAKAGMQPKTPSRPEA